MTQFELELRQGLMDANLAQYKRVLENADAAETDFSPAYLRERMRLLADPWSWMKRQERSGPRGMRRLNWRLIAIVAALLLLSACAYATVTGQFSQWFTWFGVNPEAPEQSEEVLSRTGTVIEQSQTVGDTTVTLNVAVWDTEYVYLSFTIESPSLPDDLQAHTPLHTGDCRLIMRQDQWEEYVTNRVKESCANQNMTPEETEEAVRTALEEGDRKNTIGVWPAGAEKREGNVLTFQENSPLFADWFTETKRPELTLHLENIATYADGKGESIIDENGYAQPAEPGEIVIPGPFDLTFTLNEPILPIHYGGADVEMTLGAVPIHFTDFVVSFTGLTATGEVLAPVSRYRGSPEGGWAPETDPDNLNTNDIAMANYFESTWGVWTDDGTYVDMTKMGGPAGGTYEEDVYIADMGRSFPYPIDPAAVTAVDINGTRVELRDLERLDE